MRHNWKYIGKSGNARIYVDYSTKQTRIETEKRIYIHKGIYPFQSYEAIRRFKRI